MDIAAKILPTDAAMQEIITARVKAIRQAYANNLIENMDAGADVLEAMLQRAREPISNEEFTRREEALWLQRYQVVTTVTP
jgi:DNA-binding winged helix-turn-helix (wHTH) protein